MNNFQRVGWPSNAHVGRAFEKAAEEYFQEQGIHLVRDFNLPVGVSSLKKMRAFDLGNDGSESEKVIVECKSHTWTSSGNVPSAKMTVWNEAMFYFLLAPKDYRKIFFILKDYSVKRDETLGEYYIRTYNHLIPDDVEIMEYDEEENTVNRIKGLMD